MIFQSVESYPIPKAVREIYADSRYSFKGALKGFKVEGKLGRKRIRNEIFQELDAPAVTTRMNLYETRLQPYFS